MTQSKILITHWVHDEVLNYLAEYGQLITNQTTHSLSPGQLREYARDVDAIMMFMPDSVDDDFLAGCSRLKIIAAALKGYDNYDVEACTRHKVWFTYVRDHLTVPTAELAVGHMIAIGRNMLAGDRLIRNGHFPGWRPVLYGRGLAGSTVGILGMGEVGRTIAKLLVPFSCTCLYHDIKPLPGGIEQELHASYAEAYDIYRQSDFLVCALPLNDSTVHVIDAINLDLMKKGSYLINIGRGSSVDEDAVAAALDSGKLAGYAADVFAFEDWIRPERPTRIPASLLGRHDTTFFTPHIGSAVDQVRLDIAMEAAENIVEALQGQKPHGALNDIVDR